MHDISTAIYFRNTIDQIALKSVTEGIKNIDFGPLAYIVGGFSLELLLELLEFFLLRFPEAITVSLLF